MNNETDVKKLDEAWKNIAMSLESLGELIQENPLNVDPLQRYEAYKTALAIVASNYINQMHYDRKRPESLPCFDSIFNFVGPAPDFNYRLIRIEPGSSYRVWGTRGDAEIIDFQQVIGWYGQNPEERSTVTVSNDLFDAQGIEVNSNGDFEFILSPEKQGGQWMKLDERVDTLFIREYFTDYYSQGPAAVFHVDRLAPDKGISIPNMAESVSRLTAVATSLCDFRFNFQMALMYNKIGENIYDEIEFGDDTGVADQRYFQARFNIAEDQALIGKWTQPREYLYWSISLYNNSYQMLNCVNRQVNLNQSLANIGEDGSFYYVISHRDPGVANWLDVDGHTQGMVTIRTKGASDFSMPTLQLVQLDELESLLPVDVERITLQQRDANLTARRRHFQRREHR